MKDLLHNIDLLLRGETGYCSFFCKLVVTAKDADGYSEGWGYGSYTESEVLETLIDIEKELKRVKSYNDWVHNKYYNNFIIDIGFDLFELLIREKIIDIPGWRL